MTTGRWVIYYMHTKDIEQYWTGEIAPRGLPACSMKLLNAISFSTPQEAYQHAFDMLINCRALAMYRIGLRPNALNIGVFHGEPTEQCNGRSSVSAN